AARLNFISPRSPLAIGNRGIARRRRLATRIHRIEGNIRESSHLQLLSDLLLVMVAVRRPGHEPRRILRKDLCQRLHDDVGKVVFLDSVPDTEKEMTARLKDTAWLLGALH